MTFTTNIFLIGLLPWLVLASCLLRKVKKSKMILIILANSLFYVWGGIGIFAFLFFFSVFVKFFSIIIDKTKNKLLFGIIISTTLTPLILVKYLAFIISNVNSLFHLDIYSPNLVMPIGISFFTFEAISLLSDIYAERIDEKVSLISIYGYLSLFPTVTSGPIIRYQQFSRGFIGGIEYKNYNVQIERIVIGLCKKVLIADKIAVLADYYFDGVKAGNSYSCAGLWIGSIAYTLQLYFDFSGYSDMAIGMGTMLGFDMGENFNKPYQASSISQFWKRWHISLSQWFRDYVYIPLGGNRCKVSRHIFNMLIVWLLTGIWHGADWSFVIWGMGYFVLLIVEKYIPVMKKIETSWIGHFYTLFFVNLLWIPFRASSLRDASNYILGMIGIGSSSVIESNAIRFIPYLAVAVLLCFPLSKFFNRFEKKMWYGVIRGICILVLAGLAVCAVVNTSYAPYIYGNF